MEKQYGYFFASPRVLEEYAGLDGVLIRQFKNEQYFYTEEIEKYFYYCDEKAVEKLFTERAEEVSSWYKSTKDKNWFIYGILRAYKCTPTHKAMLRAKKHIEDNSVRGVTQAYKKKMMS